MQLFRVALVAACLVSCLSAQQDAPPPIVLDAQSLRGAELGLGQGVDISSDGKFLRPLRQVYAIPPELPPILLGSLTWSFTEASRRSRVSERVGLAAAARQSFLFGKVEASVSKFAELQTSSSSVFIVASACYADTSRSVSPEWKFTEDFRSIQGDATRGRTDFGNYYVHSISYAPSIHLVASTESSSASGEDGLSGRIRASWVGGGLGLNYDEARRSLKSDMNTAVFLVMRGYQSSPGDALTLANALGRAREFESDVAKAAAHQPMKLKPVQYVLMYCADKYKADRLDKNRRLADAAFSTYETAQDMRAALADDDAALATEICALLRVTSEPIPDTRLVLEARADLETLSARLLRLGASLGTEQETEVIADLHQFYARADASAETKRSPSNRLALLLETTSDKLLHLLTGSGKPRYAPPLNRIDQSSWEGRFTRDGAPPGTKPEEWCIEITFLASANIGERVLVAFDSCPSAKRYEFTVKTRGPSFLRMTCDRDGTTYAVELTPGTDKRTLSIKMFENAQYYNSALGTLQRRSL